MNQFLAIQQVLEKINKSIEEHSYEDSDSALSLLNEIKQDLHYFHEAGIDFKIVVDSMDDSIMISDKNGKVIYVNPAHQKNTDITPDEVLGRYVSDIVKEGNLFTGGSTLDVLKEKKKIFRLATVTKRNPPEIGYTVGVPIFDSEGEIHQVVVSSRSILSLQSLQEDYKRFLKESKDSSPRHVMVHKGSDSKNSFSEHLVGSSPALTEIGKQIRMSAPTDVTVLISGESGVGKEVVADEIYRSSFRRDKNFVKINCASIPASLLESELFGYEKGSFTGASSSGKKGLFETANGGTLFLDEIGEMPLDLQAKLLRAIQSKTITRVGGTTPIPLDIRFIAATNCDLKQKIINGEFRPDLYYRINVFPIVIPPLRKRPSDIDDLIEHFRIIFSQKHNKPLVFSASNMALLRSYSWPGNVRELENVVEYLAICASGGDHVDEKTIRGVLDISQEYAVPAESMNLSRQMENYEKGLLESALKDSRNLREAGKKLGVSASTVSRRIRQYGIEYPGKK